MVHVAQILNKQSAQFIHFTNDAVWSLSWKEMLKWNRSPALTFLFPDSHSALSWVTIPSRKSLAAARKMAAVKPPTLHYGRSSQRGTTNRKWAPVLLKWYVCIYICTCIVNPPTITAIFEATHSGHSKLLQLLPSGLIWLPFCALSHMRLHGKMVSLQATLICSNNQLPAVNWPCIFTRYRTIKDCGL